MGLAEQVVVMENGCMCCTATWPLEENEKLKNWVVIVGLLKVIIIFLKKKVFNIFSLT